MEQIWAKRCCVLKAYADVAPLATQTCQRGLRRRDRMVCADVLVSVSEYVPAAAAADNAHEKPLRGPPRAAWVRARPPRPTRSLAAVLFPASNDSCPARPAFGISQSGILITHYATYKTKRGRIRCVSFYFNWDERDASHLQEFVLCFTYTDMAWNWIGSVTVFFCFYLCLVICVLYYKF